MNIHPISFLMLAVCVCLSFLFSGMEAGVFALNRLRIRQQARIGNKSARILQGLLDHPENFLWTLLVGNTVMNFVILAFIVIGLHARFAGQWVWFAVTFFVAVFLFYALCDLLPKMLFRRRPNRLCLALARPFRLARLALRPLVQLVEWCSSLVLLLTGGKAHTSPLFGNRDELRLVMQESAQSFTSEERAMINRVLDLQTIKVGQIASPIERAVTVEAQTSLGEAMRMFREHQLTRLPVWEVRDQQRRIVGLLNLDTIIYRADLDPSKRVGDFIKPAIYFEEDLRLELAMQRLQRSGQRLAVVLGRDGREVGIVGLRDMLKIIFGEVSL